MSMNASLKRVAITLVAILSFLMASAQTEQTQTATNRVRKGFGLSRPRYSTDSGRDSSIMEPMPMAVAHLDLSCVATLRTLAGMWARFYVMTLQAMTSPDMYPLPILITV